MTENNQYYETDVALLLAENYRDTEAESAFRAALLNKTRRAIPSGSKYSLRTLSFAIAAATMFAIALFAWHSMKERKPTVATSKTPLLVVIAARQPATDGTGHRLAIGDKIATGAIVRTGKGGRLNLITRHGSEIGLNSNSEIALADESINTHLAKGEIYCRNREKEIEQITTPAGSIKLLGTIVTTQVKDKQTVAVTVIEGKVRLENAHGVAVVASGKKALLVAQLAPGNGETANIAAETAWYDGRGGVASDFGDITYTLGRGETLSTEVWAMKADGSNKHRIKAYAGYAMAPGPWLPGEQVLLFHSKSLVWTTPDYKTVRADSNTGHPIVANQPWLINAATGEDTPFDLPVGYDPTYSFFSPDASLLAFCGDYRPNPKDIKNVERGVWIYSLRTGKIRKILSGRIMTPLAWAPDSRRLAVSTGEGYGINHPLVIVDVDTGEIADLKVQGTGASFSPDGTKLAYCGDFKTECIFWYCGVPTNGSIFVLDLAAGGESRRISPEGEGALQPRWSPDGTKIAYRVFPASWINPDKGKMLRGYDIFVVQADASLPKKVFHKPPFEDNDQPQAISWSPSGDAIYLSSADGVQLVATDGSGAFKNLGGNDADSILSTAQKAQTDAALLDLRKAIFQFAVGSERALEGKPAESKAAFAASAELFAAIPYCYPLAGFSVNNLLSYADEASELAAQAEVAILQHNYKARISWQSRVISQQTGQRR
jgi:Tol biopolymer transport system component